MGGERATDATPAEKSGLGEGDYNNMQELKRLPLAGLPGGCKRRREDSWCNTDEVRGDGMIGDGEGEGNAMRTAQRSSWFVCGIRSEFRV